MEINKSLFEERCYYEIYHTLLNLFEYFVKHINSYNELSEEEKQLCPKNIFDQLVI